MCRHRCAECRRTFTPAASAVATQRVCSASCRAARDRAQARVRRVRDLEGARHDERERQAASRKRRAAADCHAPASDAKLLKSREEARRFVDLVLARSRATLQRDLLWICRRYGSFPGKEPTPVTREPQLASGADDE